MKQKIIGIFPLGHCDVELVIREGTGGEFYCAPEPGKIPRIKVGVDDRKWSFVVGVLLHETMELVMAQLKYRYDQADDYGRDHSSYLFIMTHPQYSDVCARVGLFVSECLPKLTKAYKEWNKPTVKPKQRKRVVKKG